MTVSGRSSSSRWISCLNARYVVSCILASFSYLTQDIALDQFSGRTKAPAIAINPPQPKKKAASKGRQGPVLQHVPHLPKPQLKFKRKVDNTNGVVWSSTLRHKFNARVPLGYSFDPANTREELNQDLCVFLTVSFLPMLTIQVDLRIHTATKSTILPTLTTCFNPNLRSLSNHSRKLLSHWYQHLHSSSRSSTSSA